MSELALQLIAENKKTRNPYLDLGNCGLTHLPKELGECVWLEVLVLSSEWSAYDLEKNEWVYKKSANQREFNQLESLEGVEQLLYLQTLVANGDLWAEKSKLSDLSPLSGLLQLQSLYFGGTSVSDLSPLSGLLQLQSLDFSSTSVGDLSPLSGLLQLQSLYFSSTSVSDLSPLSGLLQLQSLSFSSTSVSDLSQLGSLLRLESLDFSQTPVSDLSPLGGLLQLQRLRFWGASVSDLGPLSGLWQLKHLDFWQTSVSDLGPLSGLLQLQHLDFWETSVSDLSPLGGLLQLQSLGFGEVSVSDLSPLSGLLQLQSLSFWGALVSDLYPLSGLLQLKQLFFSDTQVIDLSPLSGLLQLQELSFGETSVSNLGPLSGLLQLQSLDFGGTSVSDLSPLSGLLQLQRLDFWSTSVSDLSPLCGLLQLREIFCNDCPIKTIPPEIAFSKDGQKIRNYLLSNPTEPFNEVKLILSGNTRAGKTNLADFLQQGDKYQFSNEHNSSHGVLVGRWEVGQSLLPPDSPLNALTVNIWDFGGQDFYHGTHNLFFRHGAVYVLLWEHDKKADGSPPDVCLPEDYWLEDIRHYAPGSAVLAVQNKMDRDGEQEIRKEWLDLYGLKRSQEYHLSIREAVLKPGSKDRKDWNHFVEDLVWRLHEIPARTEAKINAKWLRLRDYIRELQSDADLSPDNPFASVRSTGRAYLKKAEFTDCCNQVVEDFEVFLEPFLTVFDHRGALLHFAENEKLRDWVFLQPDWVTEKIYYLLDKDLLNDGTFDRAFAESRLGADTDLLLELMVVFGVVFEDPRRKGKYVAVQYLPKFDSKKDSDESPDLAYLVLKEPWLQLEMPMFHQQRILRQLIVRIGSDGTYQQRLLRHDCLLVLAPNGSRIRVSGERGEHTGVLKIFAEKPDTWGLQMLLEVLLLYFEQWEEFGLPAPERGETEHRQLPGEYERVLRASCESAGDFEELADVLKKHGQHKNVAGRSLLALKNLPNKRAVARIWGQFFADNLHHARAHWADLDNASKEQQDEKKALAHRFNHLTTALLLRTNQGQNWVPFAHLINNPQAAEVTDASKQVVKTQPFAPLLKALGFEPPKKPLRVFVSYSKHDREQFVDPLLRYLSPLERGRIIQPWDDHKIPPGEEWDPAIRAQIEQAEVILLLVSTHSLNTDYIWNVEIEAAMRRHDAGTAHVVPLILSDCLWTEKDTAGNYVFPPARLNALPSKGVPVTHLPKPEVAWQAVADALKKIWQEHPR